MNNPRIGRAGQVEMIGLIIIVIIIVTVIMMYMVYKINNQEPNIKRGYVNREVATNFLITVTKVNVKECPMHTLTDLITDCANPFSKYIFCGSETSCVVAKRTLHDILLPAMDAIGKDFSFSVDNTDVLYNACEGRSNLVKAEQVFTIYPSMDLVSLNISICNLE